GAAAGPAGRLPGGRALAPPGRGRRGRCPDLHPRLSNCEHRPRHPHPLRAAEFRRVSPRGCAGRRRRPARRGRAHAQPHGGRRMRVAWRQYRHRFHGNEWGFAQADAGYRHALRLAGCRVLEVGEEMDWDAAAVVLHWSVPELYAPFPGLRNLYGTVCESVNLRPAYARCFNHPATTAVFTPSRFCQGIFQRHTAKPVFVCGHGIDHETYSYMPRAWSALDPRGQPFTFLYVGAANPRKGTDFLHDWWCSTEWRRVLTARHFPAVQLYV